MGPISFRRNAKGVPFSKSSKKIDELNLPSHNALSCSVIDFVLVVIYKTNKINLLKEEIMKTKKVQLGQGALAYFENQQEGPAVLLIHGNNGAKESFEKQLFDNSLSNYRLIALDLPGHGESSRTEESYSITGIACRIVEFSQKLNLSRPVLVGHSLGGHIAIKVSQLMDVSGLVISQTPPLNSVEDMGKGFNSSEILGLLFTADLTDEQKTFIARFFSGDQELQKRIKNWITNCDPRFRELFGASISSCSFEEIDILSNLKAPYIYLGSSHDALINQSYVKEVLGEGLFEIDSTSHFPHCEWWHLFNHQLAVFLEEAMKKAQKKPVKNQEVFFRSEFS